MLAVTAHTLSPAHAYKVYKFKKTLKAAYSEFEKEKRALLAEAEIEDPDKFNEALIAARKDDTKDLAELEAKLAKYNGLVRELLDEDKELAGVKPLPYEEWFKLQNENRECSHPGTDAKFDILSGLIEEILEGILWTAPED